MSYPVNEQIVRLMQDVIAARQYKKLHQFLASDVIYHLPGRNPFAGIHRGFGAVVRYYVGQQRHWAVYPLKVQQRITSTGMTHVAITSENEASVNGQVLRWHSKTLYFFRQALIAECWSFVDDQGACDRYWCEPVSPVVNLSQNTTPTLFPNMNYPSHVTP